MREMCQVLPVYTDPYIASVNLAASCMYSLKFRIWAASPITLSSSTNGKPKLTSNVAVTVKNSIAIGIGNAVKLDPHNPEVINNQ